MSPPAPSVPERIRAAVRRFHHLFDCYDEVRVSISGGKDSTVMMECGLLAARERDVPLHVIFFDEELIPRDTVDYIERLAERAESDPHLDFKWYCLPVRENNAFDLADPYWYPWDPRARELWGRPWPERACAEPPPGFQPGVSFDKQGYLWHAALRPRSSIQVLGRRADESPVRRIISSRGWLSVKAGNATAQPIADWPTPDVWRAIQSEGWDWSRAYLRMYRAGTPVPALRISPLFGQEPSITLHLVRKWAPDVWKAAERRLPGVAALARYARTAVMGRGHAIASGRGVSRQEIAKYLRAHPPEIRKATRRSIQSVLTYAMRYGLRVDPDKLVRIAVRGDAPNRYRMGASLRLGMMAGAAPGRLSDHGNKARRIRLMAEAQRRADEEAGDAASD